MKDYYGKHRMMTRDGQAIIAYRCSAEHFSEGVWGRYHALDEAHSLELDPDSPPPPSQLRRDLMMDPSSQFEILRWLVFHEESGELLGQAVADYPNESSPTYRESIGLADVFIYVDRAHRRRGIGTRLMELVSRELLSIQRHGIQMAFSTPSARSFFLRHGGRIVAERSVSRLYMDEVDWDRMEDWCSSGRAAKEGAELLFFEEVPEEILEDYCDVYSQCGRSAPDYQEDYVAAEQISPSSRRESESRWRNHGIRCLTFASLEKSGVLSGLTECFFVEANPHIVEQELTGVLVPYRGRGLGRWLKARMAIHVRDHFPQVSFFETGNADVNAPMLAINRGMGYRKYCDHWLGKLDLRGLEF